MVRSKMTVTQVTEYNNSARGRTVKLQAIYDPELPEDQRFVKATPQASMEIYIENPAAFEQFKPGMTFYVDFTEVA